MKEISVEFPLPPKFVRLEVEELADISRKLDVGNESLKEIKGTLVSMNAKLGSMDTKLDTLPERIAKSLKEILK